MNYIRGESQKKQVAVVVHMHLMRAIRFARWVAKELIRELTIAELGCKGQDLTSLGEMGLGSLPLLIVAKGDTAILLRLCRR